MKEAGKVYLVGAGPGDPGLLTLRARELIERCDVLVMDQLANAEVTQWVKPDCEILLMGKGREAAMPTTQEHIAQTLVDRAHQGCLVVRLKGGDPFIFGRGGEEMEVLADKGIPFEIVPGVTAALAAASYTGIPLTHRSKSSTLTFMTGHEDPEKEETRVRVRELARAGGTLVIYMGMKNLESLIAQLQGAGLPGNTPATVVQWASTPRQRTVFSRLDSLVAEVRQHQLASPAVIIVGEVAREDARWQWYENRPLFGKRVLVPRSRAQSGRLKRLLEAEGADVLEIPLITISASTNETTISEVFAEMGTYEWIVFTSPNGAIHFFDFFFRAYKDLRSLGGARIAAIGAATAREIERFHLEVDLVPGKAVAESLAEALIGTESLPSANVLVVTGNRNRDALVDILEKKGEAIVDQLPVYENQSVDLQQYPDLDLECRDGFDYVIFTSSSIVENYRQNRERLEPASAPRTPEYLSLGPLTSQSLSAAGMSPALEAPEARLEVLVQALIAHAQKDAPD